MVNILKVSLIIVLLYMIYVVISTSMESNLFTEWNYLASIPWMRATLWDFYANVLVIYLWVLYKEKNAGIKILWAILFFCLGSIATIAYTLIQLFKLKEGEPVEKALLRN
ncbi:MAG: DUF1475 domain-containing protein [Cytophagaceae bacterium]|nr:DUF1475 domain-containing protein [Cytophagaceae bacterium]